MTKMKTCKICKKDKDESEFRKNRYGYEKTCIDCRKPSTRKPKAKISYTIPDGQGGKWFFNINVFNQNTPTANYTMGLIAALGYNNPNVSVYNRSNIMIVSKDKKTIQSIAEFLQMNPKGVYELPRAFEKNEKSKWAVILYHPEIIKEFEKIKKFRRDEFKLGLNKGLKLK